MKRFNFSIKDRKILTVGLCLILVCVFTLTVAYSALSVVLTINGNAKVSAADWDIYLANPKVTNGSATTNVPEIKTSSTLKFETTLNMPGDFYEFTIDVVNDGSIDAMIENVVKTPDLTAEQSKYLKYEVSYQNGESITTKQLLAKDTTMPIKVRIEYRKDLVASDLPTGQVVLDLALTLEYVQSDGTGSNVNNNGIQSMYIVSGDINTKGSKICIRDECFFLYKNDGTTLYLISEFNLYVGSKYDNGTILEYGDEATGLQDLSMLGWNLSDSTIRNGLITYATSNYWNGMGSYPKYVLNENSNLYEHVVNYESYLLKQYSNIDEVRLITYEELVEFGCKSNTRTCLGVDSFIYSTTYWTGSAANDSQMYGVDSNGAFGAKDYTYARGSGVRPVIEIPISAFTN